MLCAGTCIGSDGEVLGVAIVARLGEVAGFESQEGGGAGLRRVWRRGMQQGFLTFVGCLSTVVAVAGLLELELELTLLQ